MPVKRQSAYEQSFIEKQLQQKSRESAQAQSGEQPPKFQTVADTQPTPSEPSPTLPTQLQQTAVAVAPTAILTIPKKIGRPPSKEVKKKATLYLKEDWEARVQSIRSELFGLNRDLLKSDGEIVDRALDVFLYSLQDKEARSMFTQVYQNWLASKPENII